MKRRSGEAQEQKKYVAEFKKKFLLASKQKELNEVVTEKHCVLYCDPVGSTEV